MSHQDHTGRSITYDMQIHAPASTAPCPTLIPIGLAGPGPRMQTARMRPLPNSPVSATDLRNTSITSTVKETRTTQQGYGLGPLRARGLYNQANGRGREQCAAIVAKICCFPSICWMREEECYPKRPLGGVSLAATSPIPSSIGIGTKGLIRSNIIEGRGCRGPLGLSAF